MTLLPVDEALERILEGVKPLTSETIPLTNAAGRVLAEPLLARRTQPPFDASAMDGFAVRAADTVPPARPLDIIGESAAGNRFDGRLEAGQAVRIFTGAPLPMGADTILIQEDADTTIESKVIPQVEMSSGRHIRRAGLDFEKGQEILKEGQALGAAAIGLAAAGGHPSVAVTLRPLVAILATGDELVAPGEECGPDQIVASNGYALSALVHSAGGQVLDLGIVPDDSNAIAQAIGHAHAAGAHILVTLGGASVGERDLARTAFSEAGVTREFWKIAMRPGKPLIFGRLEEMRVLGLPGNPVSSLVCAHVFLRPLLARLGQRHFSPDLRSAILASPLKANDGRRDYIRASVARGSEGLIATPFPIQDSSMLTTLAAANALIVREPDAPEASAGDRCRVSMLD